MKLNIRELLALSNQIQTNYSYLKLVLSFNYIYAYICTTLFFFSSLLLHLAKIYWCLQNANNAYGENYCSHIVIALSTLSLLISLLQLLYSVDLLWVKYCDFDSDFFILLLVVWELNIWNLWLFKLCKKKLLKKNLAKRSFFRPQG